jgi:hypothetical protein
LELKGLETDEKHIVMRSKYRGCGREREICLQRVVGREGNVKKKPRLLVRKNTV